MASLLVATGIALAAMLTYVSARSDNRRQLARFVFMHERRFEPSDGTLHALVLNDGPTPIRNVSVAAFEYGERRRSWRFSRSQKKWWTGERNSGRFFPLISPGDSATVDWRHVAVNEAKLGFPPIVLVFTDGNGRRWVRWPDGRMSREWRRFKQPKSP